MAENRRNQREEDFTDDGDVTDDSFRNANLSLMPEDADNARLANVLPAMKIKAELQPSKHKMVNMPMMPLNRVQRNLQDGDLQKLASAVTMEVNQMAAQLFELISMLNEVIAQKPKRVYRELASEQQKRTEKNYGEHILRQVVLTQDFSFPSEDYTGQLNDIVAKKTREALQLHIELEGKEVMPTEEIKIEADTNGRR